jgi:hypothetical protein
LPSREALDRRFAGNYPHLAHYGSRRHPSSGRLRKKIEKKKVEMLDLSLFIRLYEKMMLNKIYDLRVIDRRTKGETFSPKLAGFTDFFAQKPAKSPQNQPFLGTFRSPGSRENPDQYGLIVRMKLATVPSAGSTK